MMRGLLAATLLLIPGAAASEGYYTLSGHGGPVRSVAVDPQTGIIATASFDNSVGLWDEGGAPRWLDGHHAAVNVVTFLPDGGVVSAGDDFRVLLWPRGAAEAREIISHAGKVVGLDVARPAGLVASASWDGRIGLSDGRGPARFLIGHEGPVNAVAFSADGQRLFSGAADGTLREWDVARGTETRLLLTNGFGINTLALAPGEDWLAYGTVDGVVKIIDPVTATEIADFTLDRRPILAMDVDPVLGQLAVGDGNGYIMVLGTGSWKIIRDFRATLRGPIWAVAFSNDGTHINAGGLDTTIHGWPVATLSEQQPMTDAQAALRRDDPEMGNGERQFARKCAICHSLTAGSERRAGPTLRGLFGRRAGTVADYIYSDALDGSEIIWTEDTVDALFDAGPEHYVPGTKMPLQRIPAARDRADLIAFLRRATQP